MQIAIIGMGPAGTIAAKQLRESGFNGTITMFSAEKTPPYSPPSLGEYLLRSNRKALFWQGEDFCDRMRIADMSGEQVLDVDPEKMTLRTASGVYKFDRLLIASGSSLYAPLKGSDKKGICNFKTLAGTESIKQLAAASPGCTAAIVGGGFIGVEIALCLAKLGVKTTLLNRRGWIMPRMLDPETSQFVLKELQNAGAEVRLNTAGKEFTGGETVDGILTTNEETIRADIYIAATGVRPNTAFLANSGIKTNYGVVVNEKLQTNYKHIYACGDVAETEDLITHQSVMHGLYPVAVAHAKTAAMNILGHNLSYEKQVNMNSLKELATRVIVVGKSEGEELKYRYGDNLRKIYLQNNRIVGFTLVGDISGSGFYLSLLLKKTDITALKNNLFSARMFWA